MSNELKSNIAYYVNSTLGKDTNSGTLVSPFKTIQKAINSIYIWTPTRKQEFGSR